MFAKESKNKQIDQSTQKYLVKCDADCRGKIFKNNDIFEKVRKKKSIYFKRERCRISYQIHEHRLRSFVLKKKTIQWKTKVHAQKFDIRHKTYLLIYAVLNTHVNCYVVYIFEVQSCLLIYQKKVFSNPKSLGASYIKT